MRKMLTFSVFFVFTLALFPQINKETSFKNKKRYVSVKSIDIKANAAKNDCIILDNDTLFNINKAVKFDDLNSFCEHFKSESFVRDYTSAVQFYLPKKARVAQSRQWNSEFIVYIDKKIPKKVRKQFTSFFKQIKDVDNFKLSFTKNIDKANYWMKVSDTIVPNHKSNKIEYDESNPFSKANYNLLVDDNDKLYGGTAFIDSSLLSNKKVLLIKLKQLFFMSIGQFVANKFMPAESLLSMNYENSESISHFDMDLIKTHYYIVYPRTLNKLDLLRIGNKVKMQCKNE